MKRKRSIYPLLMIFAIVMLTACGCAKKTVPPPPPGYGPENGAGMGGPSSGEMGGVSGDKWKRLGITSEAQKREFEDRAAAFENQDVYFDFNGYTLSDPAKRILDQKIDFLKRYSAVSVTIEGNCDERGTEEYNLALGERRADASKQYITTAGGGNFQLKTVSYGKERPVSTGHDEAAWAKNRRDHFALKY
ncbi:MAG: peptidoglycan-associated lipoprotein Pal [Syntrophobacteraceae bacterium]|nr:peptidoglycan-associated lipoprotein Pal [Syntrophobacteraceae bacterium]